MVNEYGHEIVTFREQAALQVAVAAMSGATGLGESSKDQRAQLFRQLAEIAFEVADALVAASAKESA
ncbi:hypothetical protein IB276_26355 [Ensifer sp. ENS04]|uniref:hypothetical protein n=1 Tax=Ensifer sp. ENS04 TaxID=2769281 RepID=UPI001782B2F9|nr:hypothetical protein [Ensifer sp. ENS04]MBD9542972.1 hypothetical protein [Ensifer sp. ENS04]